MNIQQIRNATILLTYAGKTFLIDPMLAEKGAYPPFPNSPRQDQNNPLVDLPVPRNELIKNIDAVIVTHLHLDHWDEAAQKALPKEIKLFSQNEEDAEQIRSRGFGNVEVLTEHTVFEDIQLFKTAGEHGRGEILNRTGLVCGLIFKHSSEKTLYVAGDTVWYEGVQQTIAAYNPEVIVVNAGDNQFYQGGSLVMNQDDVYKVHQAAPDAAIVAVHMEAVNHWNLSRSDLREFAREKEMQSSVYVPEDGEEYTF